MIYIYNRAELLEKLKLIEPALSKHPRLTELQQVYFTAEGTLQASNDQIALVTSIEDAPAIGVDGVRLIKLLQNLDCETVQFTVLDHSIRIDALNFTANLPISRAPPIYHWHEPTDDMPAVYVSDAMGAALSHMRRVINPTSERMQARGVTLVRDAGCVSLYATDSKTMLKASFSEGSVGDDVLSVLTLASADQIAAVAPGWLRLAPDHVLFDSEIGDGDLVMWGRTLQPTDKLIDFEQALKDRSSGARHPIPDGFDKLVKRAGVMMFKDRDGKKRCSLDFDGSSMIVKTSGPLGTVEDKLPSEHKAVSLAMDQTLVQRLWGKCELVEFNATPKGFTLFSHDISYLMATPS